jgi:carboxypeptidase Q
MLVRSVGPVGLRTPHTGSLRYADGTPRIPAAAIAAEDAERLQRLQDRGARVTVRLSMEAHFLPDVESANVVAEIRGREKPEEVVVVAGHFDSWDVGTGATDEGAADRGASRTAPAPHAPRGPLHERRERTARRARLP